MKKSTKAVIVALFFLPGLILVSVGGILALRDRSAIDNAVVAPAKVTRVYKKTQRDLDGIVERDWVSAAFTTADGKAQTLEAQVFSTMLVSEGDTAEVRYNKADPSKARLSAGFWAEPYAVVFCVLFGLLWLAIPGIIVAIAWPKKRG